MKFRINPFALSVLALVGLGGFVVHQGGPAPCPVKAARPDSPDCCGPAVTRGGRDCCPDDPEGVRRGVVDPSVEVQQYQKAQDGDKESAEEAGYRLTGIGSGTALNLRGEVLILTAGHVVEGADRVRVRKTFDGREGLEGISHPAAVVAFSDPKTGMDLALLRPDDAAGLHPAQLASAYTRLNLGEPVWYCGSGGGVRNNLERSIINRLNYHFEGYLAPYLLVNGNGWYGHSGSGVFVRRGEDYVLAGVVLAVLGAYPKSPVFCRQPEDVRRFLADCGTWGDRYCE